MEHSSRPPQLHRQSSAQVGPSGTAKNGTSDAFEDSGGGDRGPTREDGKAIKKKKSYHAGLKLDTVQTPQRDARDDIIEDLRGDLAKLQRCCTCVICQDMLFEPYFFQCGHVFCYTCILDWLAQKSMKKKQTCPQCREPVKVQPSPAYLIKDMIETFVMRAELMSPHGSGAEMRRQQDEAIKTVEKDKASKGQKNGGLFHGIFDKPSQGPAIGLRDGEDGVLRCPDCNWEVHDNRCEGCSQRVVDPRNHDNPWSNFSDDSDSDSMLSGESDGENRIPAPDGPGRWVDDDTLDEEFEDEEEVDEDAWEDDEIEDAAGHFGQLEYYGEMSPGAVSVHTLDDEDEEITNRPRLPRPLTFASIQQRANGGNRPNRRIVNEDTEEEDSEADTEGSLQDFVIQDTPEIRRRRDRASSNMSSNDRSNAGRARMSGPWAIDSSSPVPEPVAPRRRNARRTVQDEDDDDETQSSVSEASSRPPPFLGDNRRGYSRGMRDPVTPINISSDYDDEEEALLERGYQALPHTTASETEEDGVSSPPRLAGRRRNIENISTPGSVFSVPEEDEDDETQYDDSEEDTDGDVRMSSQGTQRSSHQGTGRPPPQRRTVNSNSRPQPIEIDSDDSEPVPTRPRRQQHRVGGPRGTRSGYFSSHSRSGGNPPRHARNRLSAQINPEVQAMLSLHAQRLDEQQYNFLGGRNSASVSPARTMTPVQRNRTPVQRHYTGDRFSTASRSSRDSGASRDSTPMQRQQTSMSPPPPFSPIQSPARVDDSRSRASTVDSVTSSVTNPVPSDGISEVMFSSPSMRSSPSTYHSAQQSNAGSQSPFSTRSPQAASSPLPRTGAHNNPWTSLSPPPQPVRVAQSPIMVSSTSSAASSPRMRTRLSRNQLRNTNSRVGLRSGTSSPAPQQNFASGTSIAGVSGRPQPSRNLGSLSSMLSRSTNRRNTLMTPEDVRARGEAAIRAQLQRNQDQAALGRRESTRNMSSAAASGGGSGNSRHGLNPTAAAASDIGTQQPVQAGGRRLGALIGGGPATGRGPMLVIGSEDD